MHPKTRLITHTDIAAVVGMGDAFTAVEESFRATARGDAEMPAKIYLKLPAFHGDFRAMPGALGKFAGVKWVNVHPNNHRRGLPIVMGMIILSDPETGFPLALMDGTLITGLRTGAAAAIATRHLSRPDALSLGLIGAGVQAQMIVDAHRILKPNWQIHVNDLVPERAKTFASYNDAIIATVREAAACDIVCTSTPATGPVVSIDMVRTGAHINAIGADAKGKQELDVEILRTSRLFVDDMQQAQSSGEINVPISQGKLQADQIIGSIGDVIVGNVPGRLSTGDITVFDSTGLAIQDIALASVVYERTVAAKRGTEISFF